MPDSSPSGLPPLTLDVRPICAARRQPLPHILDAVGRLAPGQDFRLIAPFEPAPLYQLLGQQGFTHEVEEGGDGAWIITFRRG